MGRALARPAGLAAAASFQQANRHARVLAEPGGHHTACRLAPNDHIVEYHCLLLARETRRSELQGKDAQGSGQFGSQDITQDLHHLLRRFGHCQRRCVNLFQRMLMFCLVQNDQ